MANETVEFRGAVTPEVLADWRAVYLSGNDLLRAFCLLMGQFLVGFVLFMVTRTDQPTLAWASYIVFFLVMAALCFAGAIWLHRLWWRWWLGQVRPQEFASYEGNFASDGVRVLHLFVPWSVVSSAKLGDRAMLFFVNKAYCYPVHRSMFGSEASWEAARALALEHVSRWRVHVAEC